MLQRFLRATALALVSCTPVIAASLPAEQSPELQTRAEDYAELRAASLVDWLADGSLLIQTRFGATEQLHRVMQPLGLREQLTFGHQDVLGAAASPVDADRVVLLQARAGERQPSLLLRSLAGGSTRRLGDGRLRQSLPRWSNDGQRIAFAMESREGGRMAIHLAEIGSGGGAKRIAALDDQDLSVLDWSYDDSRLLLRGRVSTSDSRLYSVDLRSGMITQLEPATAPAPPPRKGLLGRFAPAPAAPVAPAAQLVVTDARFSRDGRGVYLLSTQGGAFVSLQYMDLFTRQRQMLAPQDHADIDAMQLSRDGQLLAYTLNEGGFSRLVVHDLRRRTDLLLPPLPAGSLIRALRFDAEGKRLALSVESAQATRDVQVLTLDERPAFTRWTRSETGPVDLGAWVAAQAFSFATWDRVGTAYRQIPAFLFRPRTNAPHPVLIDLHGGLASPFRPGWDPATQFAVNELGYAVIAPDLRGTPGHGTAYIALGEGRLRDDALRDIGALLVWIGLQTDLDRNSVLLRTDASGAALGREALAMYGDRIKPWNGPQILRQAPSR